MKVDQKQIEKMKSEQLEKNNKINNQLDNKSPEIKCNTETKSDNSEKITLEEIKDICPKEFLDKFELLDVIKSGSAGYLVKGRIKNQNKNINKFIGFKFLVDLKTKRENKNKIKIKNDSNKHSEISMHILLKNIHFPDILGYYKIKDYSCIAMEFIKYGDLENFKKKILKRSYLAETFVLYITGGIVDALDYLHYRAKIIHMDIKQQNILIDDFLTVKLTDFSVSINYKKIKDYIRLPMVGTCYYMSPEVLRKDKIHVRDASKIDIYSLGVLLYLLAYCDYPFNLNSVDSKDYAKILNNIENNELKFPGETGHSKLFQDFLKHCLNKDIKQRFNLTQLKNHPWYKGYQIILDEKEKLYNAGKFVIDLMVDNILPFNEYLKSIDV